MLTYFLFPVADSRRMTPGSSENNLIIVLSEKPHRAARSLTRKCFSKAPVLMSDIRLRPDSYCAFKDSFAFRGS